MTQSLENLSLSVDDFILICQGVNGWSVDSDGKIRDSDGRCPINSVAKKISISADNESAYWVGLAMGLSPDDALNIQHAADFPTLRNRPIARKLRGRLLEALVGEKIE